MLRLSTKNILAHKRRLVGTALSVIIGIAFLAGTFVFTDTIKRTFDDLFSDVYANTDVVVRSDQSLDFDQGGGTVRPRIPDSLIAQVQAVPGVQTAVGDVQGYARIIGKDNKPIAANNFATFGSSFTQTALASFHIVDGKAPAGGTEMAMDKSSADRAEYHVGDQVVVNSQSGSRTFTLAGIAKFGEADSPAGASFALFDLKTAQEFVGQPGLVDSVNAKGDGSLSQPALAQRVRAAVGNEGTEVLTGKQITEETQNDIEKG